MKAIVSGGTQINGFICPGHVSAITGSGIYRFLPDEHGIGCVISGFEPLDILQSVLMLVRQANRKRPDVEIQYTRAVKPEGNTKAVSIMNMVFSLSDEWWRGFGVIPGSGLQLREKFAAIDAAKVFPAFAEKNCDDGDCICGEILRGASAPYDCPLFGNFCNPENPAGACMVSSEGACNICFKYGKYA